MVDGNGHDAGGRFSLGNSGGPGRPKKRKELDGATLRDLIEAPTGPELYVAAMMMSDREAWMERIETDFPDAVKVRIKTIVGLSDLARVEIVRRLRDLPS